MKKLIGMFGMFGVLIVAVLLVYSFNVTAPPAPGDPPPPPPPPANDCSPGYWKNHTEVWFGQQCSSDISDLDLLDMLSPEDGGLGRVRENRENAAYILNTCEAVEPNCE